MMRLSLLLSRVKVSSTITLRVAFVHSTLLIIIFPNGPTFSDCTTPFEVSVVTDATADAIANTVANNGTLLKKPYISFT